MDFDPKPLPYADDALEPYIGRATLMLHHGEHLGGYLGKLEELIGGSAQALASLERVIRDGQGPVFDNAAQVWNHEFFWRSLKPDGGGKPGTALGAALARDFGDFDAFRRAFLAAGVSHFGSGWLWLVHYGGRLRVLTTSDADLPWVHGATALLGVDLWEHAYYLDYHHECAEYLRAVVDHLIDWDFAAANHREAEGLRTPRAGVVRASATVLTRRRARA